MRKIAIIGAGQVGSRHLQALAKCEFPFVIQVVDPSQQSLKVAEDRFKEVAPHKMNQVQFLSNISDLETEIDFCVIATTAKVRLSILRSLLKHATVTYLLLEKVVFLSEVDFKEASELLFQNGVKTWANFPRRMYPDYLRLQAIIRAKSSLQYIVEGVNFGLGCNGIHFIDHLAMLAGETDYILNLKGIDPKVYLSKRKGYVEFSGVLDGLFSNGSTMRLICGHSDSQPPGFTIRIIGETFEIVVDELNNYFEVVQDSLSEFSGLDFTMQYQSDLTNLVAEELFTTGTCRLTTFEETRNLHLPFLEAFISFVEKIDGEKIQALPIT